MLREKFGNSLGWGFDSPLVHNFKVNEMFFFGHVGITTGLVYLLQKKLNLNVDYRYVIFGSMLSDIIDKPLGNILLHDMLNNGRIIGHSLLFAMLLTIIGIRYRKSFFLAYGLWMHLLLDMMWLNPVALLWPLLGNFQRLDFEFSHFFVTIQQPYNLFGELAGLVALAFLFFRHRLYRLENISRFLSTGKLARL